MRVPAPTARACRGIIRHDRTTQNSSHERAALCQRLGPPGIHSRGRADRHLGAIPEAAGARVLLRVRRRHPRHPHHAQGSSRGHHPRGPDRQGERRTPARSGRDAHRIRQFRLDPFGRDEDLVRCHVPHVARGPAHRPPHHQPSLRRHGEDVSSRPLCQGNLPRLRDGRPVR